MRGSLGTLAAVALLALAAVPFAQGEEQTRESYKAQVEPICQANRKANERIMAGAGKRINRNKLKPAGKQFIRLSKSFGGLVRRLAAVPPPTTDVNRIERWLEIIERLEARLRLAGKYYIAGKKIRGTHTAIRAQYAGISANNTALPLHFHYCHFSNFEQSGH
jgi:hypothetical protein